MSYLQVMDVGEIRRLNVEAIADRMGRKTFAARTGISPTYVTRMLKEPGHKDRKAIGERLARRIEAKLNLAPQSLDSPPGAAALESAAAVPVLAPVDGRAIGEVQRAIELVAAWLNAIDDDDERADTTAVIETYLRSPDSKRARDAVFKRLGG